MPSKVAELQFVKPRLVLAQACVDPRSTRRLVRSREQCYRSE
jgi:hypothetical protein